MGWGAPENRGLRLSPCWVCSLPTPTGSSTVDLLIYQTLCYTYDELLGIDVDDFVLKLCGLEEFLQK